MGSRLWCIPSSLAKEVALRRGIALVPRYNPAGACNFLASNDGSQGASVSTNRCRSGEDLRSA